MCVYRCDIQAPRFDLPVQGVFTIRFLPHLWVLAGILVL